MPTIMRQGRRITDSQAKSSLEIAVIRVHVERVIRRLKTFLVLSFIRHEMHHLMNKVVIICKNLMSFLFNHVSNALNDVIFNEIIVLSKNTPNQTDKISIF